MCVAEDSKRSNGWSNQSEAQHCTKWSGTSLNAKVNRNSGSDKNRNWKNLTLAQDMTKYRKNSKNGGEQLFVRPIA